jgi:hypothetical protein
VTERRSIALQYPAPDFWNSLDFTALRTDQQLGGVAALRLCVSRSKAPSQSETQPFKKSRIAALF